MLEERVTYHVGFTSEDREVVLVVSLGVELPLDHVIVVPEEKAGGVGLVQVDVVESCARLGDGHRIAIQAVMMVSCYSTYGNCVKTPTHWFVDRWLVGSCLTASSLSSSSYSSSSSESESREYAGELTNRGS